MQRTLLRHGRRIFHKCLLSLWGLTCVLTVLITYHYFTHYNTLIQLPSVSKHWQQVVGYATGESAWLSGNLQPHPEPIVPNIAHFIWFTCHEFRFDHLIPILSAYYIMKADRIMFHTDCEPNGRWWNEVKTIPVLEIRYRKRDARVFNSTLNRDFPEHSADIARLEILLEMGGVYLDTDVVVVGSLDPLRHYEFVIGQPAGYIFNNGVIIATNTSVFLRKFYESYVDYYGDCYACNSGKIPLKLANEYSDFVHVEHEKVVEWNHEILFFGKYPWFENRYTVQVWIRAYLGRWPDKLFTDENIRDMDTALGEIYRYIYFGSRECVPRSKSIPKLRQFT
ncbi:uncharacterized protein LOC144443632 [Glandiceps talaboti]